MSTITRVCQRFLSARHFADSPQSKEKWIHPLKKQLSQSEVVQYLSQNIIFTNDEIAVFNKPAGVAKSPPAGKTLSNAVGVFQPVYMENILDRVAPLVPQLKNLRIAKFPERYTSGVMILTGTDEAQEKVAKCRRQAKSRDGFCEKYLAVSVGKPIKDEFVARFGITVTKGSGSSRKVPIIVDEWSKRSHERQIVIPVHGGHTVVDQSPLACLSHAYFTTAKANAIRLYFAAKMMSPLLGDLVFGSRVKDVLGYVLPVDPWSDVANTPQKLSPKILEALNLRNSDSTLVPLCLHLAEVTLPKFSKGKDLVLRAPPPPTFVWICQQLGISSALEDSMEFSSTNKANMARSR